MQDCMHFQAKVTFKDKNNFLFDLIKTINTKARFKKELEESQEKWLDRKKSSYYIQLVECVMSDYLSGRYKDYLCIMMTGFYFLH